MGVPNPILGEIGALDGSDHDTFRRLSMKQAIAHPELLDRTVVIAIHVPEVFDRNDARRAKTKL